MSGFSPEVSGPVGELVVQQGAGVLVGAAAQVAGVRPLVRLQLGGRDVRRRDARGRHRRPGVQGDAGGGQRGRGRGQLVAPADGRTRLSERDDREVWYLCVVLRA